MAILRYTASADNTITNAFDASVLPSLRATGSNMGKSDILEVFSIYGQNSSSVGLSSEASRILLKFDLSKVEEDRTLGSLPASGSFLTGQAKFYLCLYNAPHTETLPEDYKLTVARVTNNWEEGYGLDMDNYKDKTYDGIGSNWVRAVATDAKATGKVTVLNEGFIEDNDTITLIATDGTQVVATATATTTTSTAATTAVQFAHNGASPSAQATLIAQAINHSSYFSAAADGADVNITQSVAGYGGNSTITCVDGGGAGPWFSKTDFTGGTGKWETVGGDFSVASNEFVDVTFADGDEDIKVDITTIVEKWITGSAGGGYENYGLMIKLSSSQEPYFTAATSATGSQNTSGAKRSYYTKKFFGRGTEYFFKRPVLEARWNDARHDQRGGAIYFSSSAAQAGTVSHQNVNTIFMYNYLRGRLQDVGYSSALHTHTGDTPICKIYMSSDGVTPVGHPLAVQGAAYAETQSVSDQSTIRVDRGVYKTTFVINKEQLPEECPYLVDVWFHEGKAFYTGSIGIPKVFKGSFQDPNPEYVASMPNLRKYYNPSEIGRFRVSLRQKDWSPTIHTVSSKDIELVSLPTASYEIYRVIDNEIVVPYGKESPYRMTTHTLPSGQQIVKDRGHTMLSSDKAGNYFDLNMKLLDPGYTYGIRLSVYDGMFNSYRELPYTFKFRVRKDEY